MSDLEIVQEAQKVIEGNIDYLSRKVESLKKDLDNCPPEHLQFKLAEITYYTQQLNSWLAHKAFFERHSVGINEAENHCRMCYTEFPCHELVAQAKAIKGVE